MNIGTDFSKYPAGRFLDDGPFTGQRFRQEFLEPRMEAGKPFKVIFDDVMGCGSSFLEEAFGGLVRKGYAAEKVLKTVQLVSEDEVLKAEITRYVNDADKHRG